jgi:sirohydrochlorin cobaltochelatase
MTSALSPAGPHGRIGVLVCGHGSRNRLAVAEFAALAEALRRDLEPVPLEYGYLEFARPILRDGLDALRHRCSTPTPPKRDCASTTAGNWGSTGA